MEHAQALGRRDDDVAGNKKVLAVAGQTAFDGLAGAVDLALEVATDAGDRFEGGDRGCL